MSGGRNINTGGGNYNEGGVNFTGNGPVHIEGDVFDGDKYQYGDQNSKDEIIRLLGKLEELILEAELPEETKEKVAEDISAVKKAADKKGPENDTALKHLERMTKTIEETTKTINTSQELWNTVKPMITKIASWLGAAAGSYLLGL